MKLETYDFTKKGHELAGIARHGKNWPVVYLIHNNKEMYVGETNSFQNRFNQHLKNSARDGLKKISFIDDDEFNKSAVLDIEQKLIRLCGADKKYDLQNKNAGQSGMHNYFQREIYEQKIPEIWDAMGELKLTNHSYNKLINSNIFKYSPYTALTREQNDICYEVLNDILETLKNGKMGASVVYGGAGTGKTIVAINIVYTLANMKLMNIDVEDNDNDKWNVLIRKWKKYLKKRESVLKIGFVVPMQSLNATLSKVFKYVDGDILSNLVISPYNVAERKYDILIVDESHRLKRRLALSRDYNKFDESCKKLGMDPKSSNQLEWILKQSRHCVLFRDPPQSIKPSDIPYEDYNNTLKKKVPKEYKLTSQMRCIGGNDYLLYIEKIFNSGENIAKTNVFGDYDIKIFEDPNKMIQEIKIKNESTELCRVIAGFSWKWSTHGKNRKKIDENGLFDIELDGQKYVWNTTDKDWIISKNAINEIGCVHTTQGYDLNYVGLIFGREIDWDEVNNKFEIDLDLFFDTKVKEATPPEKVKEFIINAYKVMMVRGIKGCYMYACNPGMRKFLRKWFG